ncbi:MAG: hypothetical protein J1G02_00945 [Clostridiales bacterium]|nr:hypothetical protein [Clostridiales bacterium]
MKYCMHCGAELHDEAVICTKCGCWTNDSEKIAEVSKQKLNKLALVGFILAIVSAVISVFFLSLDTDSSAAFLFSGIPLAIAGFTCSLVGLLKLRRSKERGKALAITGIVVGALVGIMWVFLILLAVYVVILFYIFLILVLLV